MKQIFKADQFFDTKWEKADQKARFANHLVRFVESKYQRTLFYKWFYTRLSMTYQHIAHYNQYGFYEEWFSDERGQTAFIKTILTCPCYGDPTFTYSDVEKVTQEYFRKHVRTGVNDTLYLEKR